MAKIASIVKEATSEISKQIKELKQSGEDDPGKLSQIFDSISETADGVANRLARAEEALSGKSAEEEAPPKESDDDDDLPEDEDDED